MLHVGLTRTRAPTATPEDDRGEKACPAATPYSHFFFGVLARGGGVKQASELAFAAGEPCYMASAERPSPGALTWTADSRWGVGGAGYHQQQRGRPRRISMHRLPEVVHGGLLDAGLLVVRVRGREIRIGSNSAAVDQT